MEANENSGERKIKRFKVRERELAPSSLPRPSSFFPRSSAARRTDPLTEGLEQAKNLVMSSGCHSCVLCNTLLKFNETQMSLFNIF